MGDEEPGLGACDGLLPILGQTPAPAEPCEGALDDPSSRQHFEALGGIGALDDLQGPVTDLVELITQFGTAVCAVGEEMTQPWEGLPDRLEDERGAVSILDVSSVNDETDQ